MKSLPADVWQWNGPKSGPHVLILGGIHGNEVTGVMLVEQMRRDLENGTLAIAAGMLTLVIGNPRAVKLGTRGSEEHADLNRQFTTETLDENGPDTYEARRARELAPLLSGADIVVDMHATSKPSDHFSSSSTTRRSIARCAGFSHAKRFSSLRTTSLWAPRSCSSKRTAESGSPLRAAGSAI